MSTRIVLLSALVLCFSGCRSREYNASGIRSEVGAPAAIEDLLSANYNPYSSQVASERDWALARIETRAGYAMNAPSYVVLRQISQQWKIVKDALPSIDSSALVRLGAPADVASILVEKLSGEGGRVNESPDLNEYLSAHFNPYGQKIFSAGAWTLAELEMVNTGTMESSILWVLLRKENGNWKEILRRRERPVHVEDLPGVPAAEAESLIGRARAGR